MLIGHEQLRHVALAGAGTLVLAVGVGLGTGMPTRGWLVYGLGTALALWVGGAVSGQVLLARLIDRIPHGAPHRGDDWQRALDYLRQLLWIIPRFYVPMGLVALGCGVGLAALSGVSLAAPVVLVPAAIYVLTAIAGSAISAPGYVRLVRLAGDGRVDAVDLRTRLLRLAWVNRVELALVIGVGFPLLASASTAAV